jgi:Protein of unknown function (DUF2846)
MNSLKYGLVLAVAVCAAGPAQAGPDGNAARAAPSPRKTWSADGLQKKKPVAAIQEAGPGQGQIVFFRNGSMVGSALDCDVRENTKLVGKLNNGMVFAVAFDAGMHVFSPKSEPNNSVSVDVVAGQAYYLNCAFSGGRITLTRTDQKHFDEKSSKLTAKSSDELAKELAKDTGTKK